MQTMTYRQALNETLRQEMQRDPNVLLMGEEIGVFEGSYKVRRACYRSLVRSV